MSRRFPPEVHQFIRDHVHGRTCRELTELVNRHFGEPLFTESSMKSYKINHKLRSGTKNGTPVGFSTKWPPEVLEYLVEVAKGRRRSDIARLINERFGDGTMTTAQVYRYMNNHGICSGVDTKFKPGHVPANKGRKGYCAPGCERTWFQKGNRPADAVPVGTEKEREDGYVYVKVQDGRKNRNWMQKHRLIWEQAHGPVPPGHVVTFLDGDKRNFALDNLVLISRAEHGVLNKRGLRFEDSELTKTSILLAKVLLATSQNTQEQIVKELRRMIWKAIEKNGGSFELEVVDKGHRRHILINEDGTITEKV